ncbi:NRDE family protein [Pseudobacillus sp. 179-B 2D1 NHS]|uniref:NRDE family protein n=1 Tax=Pseudobacillus sp. 179-B 2D1 NHS TaxID=3374292 RepID=UPI00387A16E0
MCLINFCFQAYAPYKLVIAANRDEFFNRPTQKAHYWEETPSVLAGRDLEKMGTWLGITKTGRFAALTNFRDPSEKTEGKRSRGEIVQAFLTGTEPPEVFMDELREQKDSYPGFNLLAGTADELWHYNNRKDLKEAVAPGVHSLSNATLNTPWPKSRKGKAYLEECLHQSPALSVDCLFSFLQDEELAPDEELPRTGVSLDWERKLSPLFIRSEDYGTRSSTVVTIDQTNHVTFTERSYLQGNLVGEEAFQFKIESI